MPPSNDTFSSSPSPQEEKKLEVRSNAVPVALDDKSEFSATDPTNAHILPDVAPATRAAVETGLAADGSKMKPAAHGHGHGFGGGLPPHHPMHPSQFSGDRFERTPVLTLCGCFCVMFTSFGWINSIGVFQEYYETHQLRDYSASAISWIISFEVFFMFLGAPFVGKFYDNYGPRYLLVAGTVFHVFGLMMASLSSEYYQFILAQGICSPIGASMLFFSAMTSCISWFLKWRALAFGVIAAGASLGGVIFPIMLDNLLPKVGFGWSMRICAFLILCLLVIGNLTITSRLKPVKKPFALAEFIAPLKEKPYAILQIGSFVGFIGIFVPIAYVAVQGQSVGMSSHLLPYLVPILNGTSLFGRVIPGLIADKIGRFNTMIIMCALSAVFCLAAWIPAKTSASVVVFAALYGFGSGAYVSIMPTLVAEITKDMSKLGVRNGTSFFITSIASLIGTPIAGALVEACDGEFWGLQIFTGLSLGLAALIIFGTRTALVGLTIWTKV